LFSVRELPLRTADQSPLLASNFGIVNTGFVAHYDDEALANRLGKLCKSLLLPAQIEF
jgi:hypothetical protein